MPGKRRVLREDTRLPHVSMALSRKRALAFFNEHVLPGVMPGREVIDLSQQRVRYKPGKECRVHYRLKIAPEADERPLHQIVTLTFSRSAAPEGITAAAPNVNGAVPGKTLFIPEYGCLVEFFPADFKLPSLARAIDAEAMTAQLGSGSALAGARVTRVRRVRYRPGFTCVLRYFLEREDGSAHEVMGKLYAKPEEAGAIRRKLTALSEQAVPLGLAVPRPLDLPQADQLVLMEAVPGANMNRTLGATATADEAAPLIDIAARATAAFHALRLDDAAERTLTRYFRRLHQRLGRISRVAPLLAERARAAVERADFEALAAGAGAPTLTHGDLKPNQFLVSHGRAAIVDLDRTGVGDPVVDVANFMAVLRKKAVVDGRAHFVPLEERFLERYLEARPDDAVAQRARAFQGLALTRMVLAKFERAPRSFARHGANWPWLAVLDEAERCLAPA